MKRGKMNMALISFIVPLILLLTLLIIDKHEQVINPNSNHIFTCNGSGCSFK